EGELGIPLVLEPETGKYFPQSHSAKQLLRRWLEWLNLTAEELYLQHRLTGFRRDSGKYLLDFSGKTMLCERLVLATGGFSYPKTGSDGLGWNLLQQYVPLHPPVPALAPLVSEDPQCFSLSGYSVLVHSQAITAENKLLFESRSPLLFTHFGYSGPAAMDLAYTLKFPGIQHQSKLLGKDREEWKSLLEEYPQNKQILTFLTQYFSKAFSDILLENIELNSQQILSQLRKEQRERLYSHLARFPLSVKKTQGFVRAEVTSGGLDLSEISLNTMEVKTLPRCYVIGELLDCTGRIGGYNFLWAFSTAAVASRGIIYE
ncbi:MAG: aminoacetone oxidase family FAD-binding enzyme, partial [Planctomycetota bacterium]